MSDDPYTNLDLDTAEELLIAAGRPELSRALRYQAQGIRNLVQGEWGHSFVGALENIMDTRVITVLTSVQQRLDQQVDLVQQILTAHKETARGLKKLQGQMKDSQADRRELHREIAEVRSDVAALQARLDQIERMERSDGTF